MKGELFVPRNASAVLCEVAKEQLILDSFGLVLLLYSYKNLIDLDGAGSKEIKCWGN